VYPYSSRKSIEFSVKSDKFTEIFTESVPSLFFESYSDMEIEDEDRRKRQKTTCLTLSDYGIPTVLVNAWEELKCTEALVRISECSKGWRKLVTETVRFIFLGFARTPPSDVIDCYIHSVMVWCVHRSSKADPSSLLASDGLEVGGDDTLARFKRFMKGSSGQVMNLFLFKVTESGEREMKMMSCVCVDYALMYRFTTDSVQDYETSPGKLYRWKFRQGDHGIELDGITAIYSFDPWISRYRAGNENTKLRVVRDYLNSLEDKLDDSWFVCLKCGSLTLKYVLKRCSGMCYACDVGV
jgi:hypothetical protein